MWWLLEFLRPQMLNVCWVGSAQTEEMETWERMTAPVFLSGVISCTLPVQRTEKSATISPFKAGQHITLSFWGQGHVERHLENYNILAYSVCCCVHDLFCDTMMGTHHYCWLIGNTRHLTQDLQKKSRSTVLVSHTSKLRKSTIYGCKTWRAWQQQQKK